MTPSPDAEAAEEITTAVLRERLEEARAENERLTAVARKACEDRTALMAERDALAERVRLNDDLTVGVYVHEEVCMERDREKARAEVIAAENERLNGELDELTGRFAAAQADRDRLIEEIETLGTELRATIAAQAEEIERWREEARQAYVNVDHWRDQLAAVRALCDEPDVVMLNVNLVRAILDGPAPTPNECRHAYVPNVNGGRFCLACETADPNVPPPAEPAAVRPHRYEPWSVSTGADAPCRYCQQGIGHMNHATPLAQRAETNWLCRDGLHYEVDGRCTDCGRAEGGER